MHLRSVLSLWIIYLTQAELGIERHSEDASTLIRGQSLVLCIIARLGSPHAKWKATSLSVDHERMMTRHRAPWSCVKAATCTLPRPMRCETSSVVVVSMVLKTHKGSSMSSASTSHIQPSSTPNPLPWNSSSSSRLLIFCGHLTGRNEVLSISLARSE